MNYRKIFEKEHNIKLTKDDVIHHKDGDHNNNKIENLAVTNAKYHGKFHKEQNTLKIMLEIIKEKKIDITTKKGMALMGLEGFTQKTIRKYFKDAYDKRK